MTQKQRVINYIKRFGSISPMEAFFDLGITKLATVLSDIRLKDHIQVYSYMETATNRFGEPTCYKRYFLSEASYLRGLQKEEVKRSMKTYDPYEEMFLK